jgi:hypothetical protein
MAEISYNKIKLCLCGNSDLILIRITAVTDAKMTDLMKYLDNDRCFKMCIIM